MKKRILVVDDTPNNIRLLHNILRDTYHVSVATNGMDALELIQKEEPDLILLDIMMPDMDGYEVCTRLKNDPQFSSIPIIFVTAKGEEEDEQKGLDLGAIDYLAKPISPPIALARIFNHLALKDARDNLEQVVRERTQQLEKKLKELEARDRLVRLQMQTPDLTTATEEIAAALATVMDCPWLGVYLPGSNGTPELARELTRDETVQFPKEKECTLRLAESAADTQKMERDGVCIAIPISYKDSVAAVIGVQLDKNMQQDEEKQATETLWRMGCEAAVVLRMVDFTKALDSDQLDFDELLIFADKNVE